MFKLIWLGWALALIVYTSFLVGHRYSGGIYEWSLPIKMAIFIIIPSVFGYLAGREDKEDEEEPFSEVLDFVRAAKRKFKSRRGPVR